MKLRFSIHEEVQVDAEVTEKLREMCGSKRAIWLESGFSVAGFDKAPSNWALRGGSGDIPNLLDQQSVVVSCPQVEAPGEGSTP